MITRFLTTDFQSTLPAFPKPWNCLSFCKISQHIKGLKVQIKTIPSIFTTIYFFPKHIRFTISTSPDTHQQQLQKQFRFRNFSGNGKNRGKHWRRRKRRILQWYRAYLSRLKQQSSLREQLNWSRLVRVHNIVFLMVNSWLRTQKRSREKIILTKLLQIKHSNIYPFWQRLR